MIEAIVNLIVDKLEEDPQFLIFVVWVLFIFLKARHDMRKKPCRRPAEEMPEEVQEGAPADPVDWDELEGDQMIVIPDLFKNPPPEEPKHRQKVVLDDAWRARKRQDAGRTYHPADTDGDGVTSEAEAMARYSGRTYDVTTDDEALAKDPHTHTDGMIHSMDRYRSAEEMADRHTHTDGMIHSNERVYQERPIMPEQDEAAALRAQLLAAQNAARQRAAALRGAGVQQAEPAENWAAFTDDPMTNAVIMAEILGKPRALELSHELENHF